MKTVIRALALGAAFALSAAQASAQGQPLRVGVDGTFAPHAFPNLSGGVQGFNIDLIEEIGKKLGRKVEITAAQFSGLIPALQAGSLDLIGAPVTLTAERAQNLLFSEGYLNTDYQFIVKKGAPPIKALDDLKGKVISVNKGSVYDSWARGLADKIGWTVESFGTQTDAAQAVMAGRAYANVAGNTVTAWAAKNNPQIEATFIHKTGLVFSFAMRKDQTAFRAEMENALECLKLDGTVARIHEKWLGAKPEAGSAAVTVFPGTGAPGYDGHDAAPREPKC